MRLKNLIAQQLYFLQLADVLRVMFGMFTAPNFLKHFADFSEKTLWNDSAVRQSVRGPVLDHGVL